MWPANADELRDQWTAVHGLAQRPDRTSAIRPNATRHEEYLDPDDGSVTVEVNRVPWIGHGNPVDTGQGDEQCGQTGQYYPDSICASHWIVRFLRL